jgi:cytochrome d ubiquinol oxidase subunit II
MFAVLAALILRPVAFKYRSKRDQRAWRSTWDWALFVGGAVPALIFGVAVGNVLQGVPFDFTEDLYTLYPGSWFSKFIGLLNPFALLAGVVSLSPCS